MFHATLTILFFLIGLNGSVRAEDDSKNRPIGGLFGAKPIQLSVDSGGVHKKDGGFICDLDAELGAGHYSEWGETEKDARTIVHQKCSNKSGVLICKKDKIICKQDK